MLNLFIQAQDGIRDHFVTGLQTCALPIYPTQIFEGSDGGVISTSGTFADISSQCDEAGRDGATGGPVTGVDNVGCKRLLSRVPVVLDHINRRLSSTLQFINVAINPANSCEVMGGTQDN